MGSEYIEHSFSNIIVPFRRDKNNSSVKERIIQCNSKHIKKSKFYTFTLCLKLSEIGYCGQNLSCILSIPPGNSDGDSETCISIIISIHLILYTYLYFAAT